MLPYLLAARDGNSLGGLGERSRTLVLPDVLVEGAHGAFRVAGRDEALVVWGASVLAEQLQERAYPGRRQRPPPASLATRLGRAGGGAE